MITAILTTSTAAPATKRRRRSSGPGEPLIPCDHCRGEGVVPADEMAHEMARNRGLSEPPLFMGCPACRNANGRSVGVRRVSDQREHPYIPDTIPSHWTESVERPDPEPVATLWPRWGEPRRKAHPGEVQAIVASIREAQQRRGGHRLG